MNSTVEDDQQERRTGLAASMPPALYESLSALLQRLCGSRNESAVRTILLTAPRPGSGASYISSCISTLLAEMFGTVLLADGQAVDAVSRRRAVPMRSDCTSVRGSRLSVLGKAEARAIVAHTGKKEEKVRFVIDSLLNEFDYVIVDAPALSISKAAQTISPHVDAVLLVVVPNETDIGDITAARRKLLSSGSRVLGAIYNTALDQSDTTTGYTPCND